MPDVKRQTTKGREWKSWAGSLADLKALTNAVERNFEQRRNTILSDLDKRLSEMKEGVGKDETQWDRNRYSKKRVEVAVEDGSDSSQGPPEQILEEIDRRTVREVRISGELGHRDEVSVLFARQPAFGKPGIRLKVISPDQGWARQTFAHLSDEIEKGVPRWWGNLRGSPLLGWGTAAALWLAATLILYSVLKDRPPSSEVKLQLSDPITSAIFGATVVFILFVMGGIFDILEKVQMHLFPPFELTGEDGASSGSKRIAYVVTLTLSVVTGVVVNLLT